MISTPEERIAAALPPSPIADRAKLESVEAKPMRLRPVAPIGVLAEKLERLVREANALASLDPGFVKRLEEAGRIASGLDPYVASCATPESAALSALVEATESQDWDRRFREGATAVPLEAEMVSGHVEGQFLKMLVHASKAERILEIGLFTGYSALAMAEALPNHGVLVACEVDAFAAEFAAACFARSPHGDKIRIERGPATETMRTLRDAGETFELIFIDADKASYPDYFELALGGGLLAPGGLICVDNTLMQGEPWALETPSANGRAIRDFNRMVRDDPRVEQVLLPLRDGVTLIRRADER